MYPPAHFQTDDIKQLQQFLQLHYFGLLISQNGGLHFSALPFLFDWHEEPGLAYCHMARNNPQLQQLDGSEVSIIIQGPHAFVAASCYQRQPAVSTWNYALAELTGKARVLDAQSTLALVRQQEAHSAPDMLQAADYQQQLVKAIVGVEIRLNSVKGRFKLSQNKPETERQTVVRYLQQTEQPNTVWQMMHMLNNKR